MRELNPHGVTTDNFANKDLLIFKIIHEHIIYVNHTKGANCNTMVVFDT